jgi:8-oxo-(d)GTP phosphatase
MPSNKPESKLIKAAGAVAWRPGPDGQPQILLVHRKKYDDWSLPKGKIEPGEPLAVTAVREVYEEGGTWLALGRRLGSVRYNVGGRPKRVHYWAARVTGIDERAVPNGEVDQVEWLPVPRAIEQVSYPRDHGVLNDFAARPAGTVPLILLRHAKAVSKSGWEGADADRPLDDAGRADAQALAEVLACFAPRDALLISSPAVRCTETLRPFGLRFIGEVRTEDSLYIHNPAGTDPAALRSLVAGAVAAGQPAVICAHRENLPALQEAALAALAPDRETSGPAVDEDFGLPRDWDTSLPTAGFWVLNVAPLPAIPATAAPEGEAVPVAPALEAPAPEAPAPEAPAADAPVAASRRRWLRGRVRIGAPLRPGQEAGQETEPEAGPEAGVETEPGGVLVSADRYDLSET